MSLDISITIFLSLSKNLLEQVEVNSQLGFDFVIKFIFLYNDCYLFDDVL